MRRQGKFWLINEPTKREILEKKKWQLAFNEKIWGERLGQKYPNLEFKTKDIRVILGAQLNSIKERG